MGRGARAALANMAAYQGYAAVAYPQGSLLSWTTVEKGGIIVGDDARRFGDESLGYSGYAREVLGRGGRAYAVFDQNIFDIAAAEEEFMELWNYGGLKRGDTAGEIAHPSASIRKCSPRRSLSATSCGRDRARPARTAGFRPRAPHTPLLYRPRRARVVSHPGRAAVSMPMRACCARPSPGAEPFRWRWGGGWDQRPGRRARLRLRQRTLSAIALGRLAALAAARELGSTP